MRLQNFRYHHSFTIQAINLNDPIKLVSFSPSLVKHITLTLTVILHKKKMCKKAK